jgi:hypothetical protein
MKIPVFTLGNGKNILNENDTIIINLLKNITFLVYNTKKYKIQAHNTFLISKYVILTYITILCIQNFKKVNIIIFWFTTHPATRYSGRINFLLIILLSSTDYICLEN